MTSRLAIAAAGLVLFSLGGHPTGDSAATGMMFIAAVTVDPEAQEIYTVDNDIGDRLLVFPYDANGNAKPTRVLDVPHQAWGLSISRERNEMAVSVEAAREIVVYRKGAQ